MRNELSFGVEFTRDQIESILKDPGVTRIVVSGSYTHKGKGAWQMNATVAGSPTNKTGAPMQADCIQPCPGT